MKRYKAVFYCARWCVYDNKLRKTIIQFSTGLPLSETNIFRIAEILNEEYAELNKNLSFQNKWISGKEKLPPPGINVLVFDPVGASDNPNKKGVFIDSLGYMRRDANNNNEVYAWPYGITHWMPLPKPPI